jgi:hypothetical protein
MSCIQAQEACFAKEKEVLTEGNVLRNAASKHTRRNFLSVSKIEKSQQRTRAMPLSDTDTSDASDDEEPRDSVSLRPAPALPAFRLAEDATTADDGPCSGRGRRQGSSHRADNRGGRKRGRGLKEKATARSKPLPEFYSMGGAPVKPPNEGESHGWSNATLTPSIRPWPTDREVGPANIPWQPGAGKDISSQVPGVVLRATGA